MYPEALSLRDRTHTEDTGSPRVAKSTWRDPTAPTIGVAASSIDQISSNANRSRVSRRRFRFAQLQAHVVDLTFASACAANPHDEWQFQKYDRVAGFRCDEFEFPVRFSDIALKRNQKVKKPLWNR
jgi:hypothetical protein